MTPGKGTQKYVTSPPQWDGFLYVLNTSYIRSISLDGVENPDKDGTERELTRKNSKNMTMMGGSKLDQKYRLGMISRKQKVVNEWKNHFIYNKILSQSRYWCIIKILLTKYRSNFYGIFYYFCWREKEFEFGQIPLFVNNK